MVTTTEVNLLELLVAVVEILGSVALFFILFAALLWVAHEVYLFGQWCVGVVRRV